MNIFIKYLFIVITLQFFIFTSAISQEILPKGIKKAVVEGSSKKFAEFFNKDIELSIKNKEDVYSKAQAQLIIKDFFKKNHPSNFKIILEGKNSDSNFAICDLETALKSFKVYLLYQKVKNKAIIHKLEITENW